MDLHTELNKNMEQIVSLFEARMNQFDTALAQSQPQFPKPSASGHGSLEALGADFKVFKELMWKTLTMMRQQLQLLSTGFDNHEMYSRRKVLLFHGLPENDDDNVQKIIDTLCNQMKLSILGESSIDACHRLGVKKLNPRPVLIRFTSMKLKNLVWHAKTTLKGSGITISEFLTKPRQEAFVEARKHFGMRSCWTSDGVIVIALPDKTRKKLTSLAELQPVIKIFPQIPQLSQDPKSSRSRRTNKNSGK